MYFSGHTQHASMIIFYDNEICYTSLNSFAAPHNTFSKTNRTEIQFHYFSISLFFALINMKRCNKLIVKNIVSLL